MVNPEDFVLQPEEEEALAARAIAQYERDFPHCFVCHHNVPDKACQAGVEPCKWAQSYLLGQWQQLQEEAKEH